MTGLSGTETGENPAPGVSGPSKAAQRPSEPPGIFPPAVIKDWIEGKAVPTELLARQLHEWGNYFTR